MSGQAYALLIGVDCYLPHSLEGGGYYPCLGGSVQDITLAEAFLRRKLEIPEQNLLKLTATYTGPLPAGPHHGYRPPEAPELWPTHDNIVNAFKKLAGLVRSGDQLYIHYSGHGGRAKTQWPDIKGAAGLDEGLVPLDIGHPGSDYVRDFELVYLLKQLVATGALVTLVLDCCHSGGAVRGLEVTATRGIGITDRADRSAAVAAASDAELKATWREQVGAASRNLQLGSGWLPEPQGYTLLAACRDQESAYETVFEGTLRNGALTYWLLDSLRQLQPNMSYRALHNRILAKVHTQFVAQTPQLEGVAERAVFGSDRVQAPPAVNVMDVQQGQVLINAGGAQGLREGARFVIYPPGAQDLTAVEDRLALADLVQLGAADSWLAITQTFKPAPIEAGARAVVLDTGNLRLQRAVGFVTQSDLPGRIDQAAALTAVQAALPALGRFAHVAGPGEAPAFQVAVNQGGEYEIWDPAGRRLRGLPVIALSGQDAPVRVAGLLDHLARYRNVQELDNADPLSPLAGKLAVELVGKMQQYDPADRPAPVPFDDPGGTPILRPGEWVFLRIRNVRRSANDPNRPWLNTINVTMLDLAPDGSIVQVYPSDEGSDSVPLDPESELPLIPLRASLPPGQTEAVDVVKVFGTDSVQTTSFRWLELPPFEQPRTRGPRRGAAPGDPLSELFADLVENAPKSRNLTPAAYPSRGWTVVQVELHVMA